MMAETKNTLVLIGTSGSDDYLKSTASDRRFWPVTACGSESGDVDARDVDAVRAYVELTPRFEIPETYEPCDGIHDEGAPPEHLCTRCFPDLIDPSLGGDLLTPEGDEHDRDEAEEME